MSIPQPRAATRALVTGPGVVDARASVETKRVVNVDLYRPDAFEWLLQMIQVRRRENLD